MVHGFLQQRQGTDINTNPPMKKKEEEEEDISVH